MTIPRLRISLLTVLLGAVPVAATVAQPGQNFLVLHNGADAIFAGVGAGGNQVGGVDGIGTWIDGESLRGNTLTTLGDFGYKQVAWRENVCVLGQPVPSMGLKFPQIAYIELSDALASGPGDAVFGYPVCGVGFPCVGVTSAGMMPYGTPPGSSASFLLAGLPSGVPFASSAMPVLLPNAGLLPSSNGGVATLLGAASAVLPISSTGFCWLVEFGWLPSAVPSADDLEGWWTWRTNSPDDNQYWNLSDDELNIWKSNTVVLDGGATALIAFNANVQYATNVKGADPCTNLALAPVGAHGSGTYGNTGAGVPLSGNSVNGGFDLGTHSGVSIGGLGGTVSSLTGLGNQDPAGSPTAGLVPTIGFVTFNSSPSTLAGTTRFHLTWVQIWFDLTSGVDPSLAADVPVALGNARLPLPVQVSGGGFLQPLTTSLLTVLAHVVDDQTGQPGWPDPDGFGGGPMVVGSSIHLPLGGLGSVSIGLPVALQAGTSQLASTSGPLLWGGPSVNAPGTTTAIPLID